MWKEKRGRERLGLSRESSREKKEQMRGRERWERRKEAGHEHMLPFCAKPHWLGKPTQTLHCCCSCHSSPTPWHYLVKQSCGDESGKSQGLPSLSTARLGLLSLDNTTGFYRHTYCMFADKWLSAVWPATPTASLYGQVTFTSVHFDWLLEEAGKCRN